MDAIYKKFYRNLYLRTEGFIPAQPMQQHVYPGDFFQIKNGEMIVLGNIFRNDIIDSEACRFENGVKLNPAYWKFSHGVTKPYSGRSSGQGPADDEFEFSKQILAFGARGSFFFTGNDPEAVRIANWQDFQQQLIIRMTQVLYSFRELYIISEIAATSDWTLAISSSDKGELEIATSDDNFGLVDIFGHHSAKTIQSKDIEFYQRENNRRPAFFKAKKLVVQEEKRDVFMNGLTSQRHSLHEWANDFFDYSFHQDTLYSPAIPAGAQASALDMLKANELNPTSALQYFKWVDASLDDVEKLFLTYGN